MKNKMLLFPIVIVVVIVIVVIVTRAEYFNVDIGVDTYTIITNNASYSIINITTENLNKNFTITNTSNFHESFIFTIWREVGKNQTDIENITNQLRLIMDNAERKGQCDYLLGINQSVQETNNTFYSIFDDIRYKSKADTCESEKGVLNSKISVLDTENKKGKENLYLWGAGGAIIASIITYSMWKGPRKVRQPGGKAFADLSGGGRNW